MITQKSSLSGNFSDSYPTVVLLVDYAITLAAKLEVKIRQNIVKGILHDYTKIHWGLYVQTRQRKETLLKTYILRWKYQKVKFGIKRI